jgi:hypothetical protein
MTTPPNQPIPPMVRTLADNMGFPAIRVPQNCHAVSLALVQSGLAGPDARVVRGWAKGVSSQHSWVAVGDAYDMDAHIIDATLWSYDDSVPDVWQGTLRDGIHHPHGAGHFMKGTTPPQHEGGKTIHLTPSTPLSREANRFLSSIGAPFDRPGWSRVAHLPVEGWPAKEIIEAILDTDSLAVLVPIDIAGNLTDRNPSGLYRANPSSDRMET